MSFDLYSRMPYASAMTNGEVMFLTPKQADAIWRRTGLVMGVRTKRFMLAFMDNGQMLAMQDDDMPILRASISDFYDKRARLSDRLNSLRRIKALMIYHKQHPLFREIMEDVKEELAEWEALFPRLH